MSPGKAGGAPSLPDVVPDFVGGLLSAIFAVVPETGAVHAGGIEVVALGLVVTAAVSAARRAP